MDTFIVETYGRTDYLGPNTLLSIAIMSSFAMTFFWTKSLVELLIEPCCVMTSARSIRRIGKIGWWLHNIHPFLLVDGYRFFRITKRCHNFHFLAAMMAMDLLISNTNCGRRRKESDWLIDVNLNVLILNYVGFTVEYWIRARWYRTQRFNWNGLQALLRRWAHSFLWRIRRGRCRGRSRGQCTADCCWNSGDSRFPNNMTSWDDFGRRRFSVRLFRTYHNGCAHSTWQSIIVGCAAPWWSKRNITWKAWSIYQSEW